MDLLLIAALIIWIVSEAKQKKKKAAKRSGPANDPARSVDGYPSAAAAASAKEYAKSRAKKAKKAERPGSMSGSIPAAAFDGDEPAPSAKKVRGEGSPVRAKAQIDTTLATDIDAKIDTRLKTAVESERHTLEASQLTGHSHMETSMTGFDEKCEPARPEPVPAKDTRDDAYAKKAAVAALLGPEDMRRAVILSEILDKPKALRRGAVRP